MASHMMWAFDGAFERNGGTSVTMRGIMAWPYVADHTTRTDGMGASMRLIPRTPGPRDPSLETTNSATVPAIMVCAGGDRIRMI